MVSRTWRTDIGPWACQSASMMAASSSPSPRMGFPPASTYGVRTVIVGRATPPVWANAGGHTDPHEFCAHGRCFATVRRSVPSVAATTCARRGVCPGPGWPIVDKIFTRVHNWENRQNARSDTAEYTSEPVVYLFV